MLTEAEVQRSFRTLFKNKDVSPEAFERAEALLDELRAESPLRHRLSLELEEIRKRDHDELIEMVTRALHYKSLLKIALAASTPEDAHNVVEVIEQARS